MRGSSRRSTAPSNNSTHAPDHQPSIVSPGPSLTSLHEPTQPSLCRIEASPKRSSVIISHSAHPQQIHQDCNEGTKATNIGDAEPLARPHQSDKDISSSSSSRIHSPVTTTSNNRAGASAAAVQPLDPPQQRSANLHTDESDDDEVVHRSGPTNCLEASLTGDDDNDEPHLHHRVAPVSQSLPFQQEVQSPQSLGHVAPSHAAVSSSPPGYPNTSIASHQSSVSCMNCSSGIDERPLLPSEAAGGGDMVSPYGTADSRQQQQQQQHQVGNHASPQSSVPPPSIAPLPTDASYVDNAALTRYPYTIAIVNPLSGERSASNFVYQCLCDDLGPSRVLRLSKELFSDPRPIRELMLRAAVRRDDGVSGSRGGAVERGTVVVSGGDGTVSFVMSQIDILAEQFGVDHINVVDGVGATSPTASEVDGAGGSAVPRMPAVAVLALGTGNDFSNCMGFGNGYTKHKLCCMCVCCVNHVATILSAVVKAPATTFDRWVATIAPQAAASTSTPSSSARNNDSSNDGSSGSRSVIFMNYFSLGMDAFIATHFDRLRKKYPSGFQYRFQNKAWYGGLGLYGAAKCDPLNSLVPKLDLLIEAAAARVHKATAPTQSGGVPAGGAQPQQPPRASSASSSSSSAKTMLSTVLPPKTKALVLSNVNSYSGGTVLWHPGNRGSEYCTTRTPSKVHVNDKLFEVQALGGLVDMTMLQLKIGSGADKLAQAQECVLTVGSPSSNARRLKVAVPLQADGEPIGSIDEPSTIRVRLYNKQIYVRCANSAVIKVGLGAASQQQQQAADIAHLL